MTTKILVQTSSMPMRASLIALATASLLAACPAASFAQGFDQSVVAAQEAARAAQSLRLDSARIAEASRAALAESLAVLAQDPQLVGPLRGQLDRSFSVFGESSAYEAGISALDSERWQSAVDTFNRVIKSGKTRVDGAMYWKAYALNRLGQRTEAQAALQELFKAHPNSRYLDDARALEIELKQGSGQSVRPEDQANDELKSIAFSALMRNDPDRAIPIGQQLLQGRSSPKLKQQILFSLAMSATPKAQEVVAAIARGGQGINPDVQMKAIKYLGVYGRNNTSLLGEVYTGTKDPDVKRQIIRSLGSAHDDKQLVTIAKSETTPELRVEAIRQLGSMSGVAWVLNELAVSAPVVFPGTGTGTGSGSGSGSGVGRGTGGRAVFAGPRGATTRERAKADVAAIGEALVQIYRTDKDITVKKAVVSALSSQQNAKALVDIARAETNPEMKREIVSRLSSMKSKEATDYLMELLK
jgi:tetratricopeptide (TPR) repeat protein